MKNLAQSGSSLDQTNSDEDTPQVSMQGDTMNENKEIASLKQRLNTLREKMYSNQNELQLSTNEFVRPKKDDSMPLVKLEWQRKDAMAHRMLNIESLDLKAKYLIDRR